MIWMTWQQHRLQALIAGAALALLALFLLLTGLHIAADYQQIGGTSCPTIIPSPSGRCAAIFSTFEGKYINTHLIALMLLLMFIPLVVGILVGAPLVAREFRAGNVSIGLDAGHHAATLVGGKAGSHPSGRHLARNLCHAPVDLVVRASGSLPKPSAACDL